jgi:hypothetical protein
MCTRSARIVEPYTEIAFPWDIAKAAVAGKRPEWRADRRVPDWFAALVRRMWAPDAAARSVVQHVLLELDAQRCRCRYGDSDSDDRSSVDEIVRTLSLRETRKSTTVNRISRIEGVTCLGRLLSRLKFESLVVLAVTVC